MVVQKLDFRTVRLIPDTIVMESEKVLTQYFITTWSLVYRNTSKVVTRNSNFLLDTNFTMLLIIICLSKNYKPTQRRDSYFDFSSFKERRKYAYFFPNFCIRAEMGPFS